MSRTQQQRRTETIGNLIDATIDSLCEKGYAATTVSEIVARAGVSSGALFRHFPTRLDLLVAAAEEVRSRQFTEFRGEGTAGAGVNGQVVIEAASVRTGIGKRDNHLRSADFFDVEGHPEITVQVTGLEPSDDRVRLTAVLTVRGVSKPIELPVDVQALDDGALRLSGQCEVQRDDFGVSGDMLGMVGPTTILSGELVFTRV